MNSSQHENVVLLPLYSKILGILKAAVSQRTNILRGLFKKQTKTNKTTKKPPVIVLQYL